MSAVITKPTISDVWGQTNTSSPDMAAPSYIDTGFPAPSGTPVKPPRGYINWLFNWLMNAVRYYCAHGLPEWDAAEDSYNVGFPHPLVRDNDDKIYSLTGTATTGVHPRLDPTNWELWLASPIAAVTAYASEIWAWRNANKQRIFGIDHLGFPAGRFMHEREDWHDVAFITHGAFAAGANWARHWAYGLFGSGTSPILSVGVLSSLANNPWGPNLKIDCNNASAPVAGVVEDYVPWIRAHSGSMVMECDQSITGSADIKANSTIAWGFGDGTLAAGGSVGTFADSLAATFGCGFARRASGTTWVAWVKPTGGSYAEHNTGVSVARNAPHRFRIQYTGTNASDDGVARVVFLIDGAEVANLTGDFTASGGMNFSRFFRMQADNTETCASNWGPLVTPARLAIGDTLI